MSDASSEQRPRPDAVFMVGGGRMGALMRAHHWSTHPLGEPFRWSRELKTLVGIMLAADQPMFIAWGPEHLLLYNDGYAPMLADRHPAAFGRPFLAVWPEVRTQLMPMFDQVFAGDPVHMDDLELYLERPGRPREAHFAFSYTPVRDEAGTVVGLFCPCTETTEQVLAERDKAAAAERQRSLFQQMPGFVAVLGGPNHVFEYVNDAYITIVGARDFIGRGVREVLPELEGQGFYELLDQVYATGTIFRADDVPLRLAGEMAEGFVDLVYQPVRDEHGVVTGIFVGGYDTTDRVRAEKRRDAIVQLDDRLRDIPDTADLSRAMSELLGEVLGASRVGYGLIDLEAESITVERSWDAPGLPSVAGVHRFSDYGSYMDDLRRGLPVANTDVEVDPRTAANADAFRSIGIRAHLDVPVIERGRTVAQIFVHSATPRAWTDEDVALVHDFAERTRSAVARREAEGKLRASQEHYRQIVEGAEDFAIITLDDTGVIAGWNAGAERLLGFPEAEAVGQPGAIFFTPEDRESAAPEDEMNRAESAGRAVDERWHQRKDGSRFWGSGLMMRLAGGGYLKIFRDRTAEHEAEAALLAGEVRYRTLFDAIESGFCLVEVQLDSPDGQIDYRILEANPAFERHTGLIGAQNRWLREFRPDLEEQWFETYGRIARTGQPERFEQGSTALGRWFDVYAFRVGAAEDRRVAILFTDISARRNAEERLRDMNEMLERRVAGALAERKVLADIVEGTDAFVQVAGPDYRWLAINKAASDEFEAIYGVRPKVGDSMLDLLADHPEHRAAVKAVWSRALAGEEFTEVGEFGDPDRDRRHYEMKYNVLHDAGGHRIGAFQFVYDVTQRVRDQQRLAQAEEQLRQAQKMEAVGQLTGGIAHDFNNLLTGIIGSLDILQRRAAEGRYDQLQRYTGVAITSAQRAAALTQRLLAFSRRQPLDPKPVQANKLVASMEDLLRRTLGPPIDLEFVLAGGLWPTLCDPNQLESALLNLAINARDAMPNGGRLTIETENTHLDNAYARSHGAEVEPGPYVMVVVTDTGTGIPRDQLARIFEPFFTTKPIGQGTGLGLSQLYGFAKQSGGHVAVHSEVDQGTTFRLYLPRHRGKVAGVDDEPNAADVSERAEAGETVLVVDDEAAIRMVIVETLEELGYGALEAIDGPSGLKAIQSEQRIDLLVTDVGLPGLNGRQLADAARQLRPGLKVLFITGYAGNAAVGNGVLDPGMEILAKPFAMDQIAGKIREMMEQS